MESLESLRSGYSGDQSQYLYDVIRYFINDTIDPSPKDSIIYYLDASGFLWAKCHEAFVMKEKGDVEGANQLMDQLGSIFHLDQELSAEVQQYMDYFSFQDDCSSQEKSIFQADSSQIQSLLQIAQNSRGLAGIYSMNLLIALNNYSYQEPYILPDTGLKDSHIKWIRNKRFTANTLKLYPNPAHSYFIVEYTLEDRRVPAIFEMNDCSGSKVVTKELNGNKNFLVIPVENLANGIYICKLISNNKKIMAGKIVISK